MRKIKLDHHLIIWLHHELGILSFPFREPISSFVIQPLNQNVCLRLPSCKIHVSVCCQFLEVQKLGKNHYPNFIEIINKLSSSYYCCYWIQWKKTSKIFWIPHCWQKARKFLGQKEKLCNYFDVNFDTKRPLKCTFCSNRLITFYTQLLLIDKYSFVVIFVNRLTEAIANLGLFSRLR